MKRFGQRSSAASVVALTALLTAGLVTVAVPAPAQVPFGQADFSGYATGTDLHADLLQSGDTRAENTEVAFSGASVDSRGLTTTIVNELERVVQPELGSKRAYGRGTGLEIGLGVTPEDENQIILAGKAEASAPPPSDLVTEEIGPVPADPLAYASLLRGQAIANYRNDDTCPLGAPLSLGLGYAADVQLVDQAGSDEEEPTLEEPVVAADAPNPERAVSQSRSRTQLVPQTDATGKSLGPDLGLMSEVRETIAPVTFFKNTANEFTIEILGEWVLRAVATGEAKGAYVHYGPGEASPETPIIRIIQDGEPDNILTFQDLFGEEGLVVEIPGVAELAIGEDPRAIGGNAESAPVTSANGTLAAAAVDVVRVKLLEQTDDQGEVTFRAAQVRLGHMEARAQVPVGGISCGIDITKNAEPSSVQPGEEFTYTVTAINPFSCTLTDVKVVDTITTTPGITFDILSTDPEADSIVGNTITWNDVGPIKPGESVQLRVRIRIGDDSAAGRFTNEAVVTSNCGIESAQGEIDVNVPVDGRVVIHLPTVDVVLGRQPDILPVTGGGNAATLIGAALLLLSAATVAAALRGRRTKL